MITRSPPPLTSFPPYPHSLTQTHCILTRSPTQKRHHRQEALALRIGKNQFVFVFCLFFERKHEIKIFGGILWWAAYEILWPSQSNRKNKVLTSQELKWQWNNQRLGDQSSQQVWSSVRNQSNSLRLYVCSLRRPFTRDAPSVDHEWIETTTDLLDRRTC